MYNVIYEIKDLYLKGKIIDKCMSDKDGKSYGQFCQLRTPLGWLKFAAKLGNFLDHSQVDKLNGIINGENVLNNFNDMDDQMKKTFLEYAVKCMAAIEAGTRANDWTYNDKYFKKYNNIVINGWDCIGVKVMVD